MAKFTEAEKIIVRNQRLIMLTLSCMIQNAGGMASGYHGEKLRQRVIQLENNLDWLAAPGEKIT
jgi:hypothetical protein